MTFPYVLSLESSSESSLELSSSESESSSSDESEPCLSSDESLSTFSTSSSSNIDFLRFRGVFGISFGRQSWQYQSPRGIAYKHTTYSTSNDMALPKTYATEGYITVIGKQNSPLSPDIKSNNNLWPPTTPYKIGDQTNISEAFTITCKMYVRVNLSIIGWE